MINGKTRVIVRPDWSASMLLPKTVAVVLLIAIIVIILVLVLRGDKDEQKS